MEAVDVLTRAVEEIGSLKNGHEALNNRHEALKNELSELSEVKQRVADLEQAAMAHGFLNVPSAQQQPGNASIFCEDECCLS